MMMTAAHRTTRMLRGLMLGLALGAMPALASAQALPDKIKKAGELVVGIEATYPPMAYRDPKTNERVGFNAELVTAIAKELGITVKWEEMAFEQFAPALATGRIDMIGTALTDLPTRRDKMTFVDYFVTGSQLFTTTANAATLKQALDFCGKSVGMPRTTSYLPIMKAWSEKNCAAAGKPLVEISGTTGASAARLDLRQGRIDGAILGPEYVFYLMQDEPGAYAIVGDQLTRALFGFAFNKGDEPLRDAVAAALARTMQTGAYAAALKHYGLERQAVSAVTIDAGT
jgi:polar amino acid transport system substrate-binding protein